jgi:frataxin-like iron-binding protein CyaY
MLRLSSYRPLLKPFQLREISRRLLSDIPRPTSRKRSSPTPEIDFAEEAQRMFKSIEAAVAPLESQNTNFNVSYGNDGELVIATHRGRHILKVDGNRRLIVLQSYFSGFHKYAFFPEEQTWLSIQDGHDLRGLLTRDLMRHCIGVPAFQ